MSIMVRQNWRLSVILMMGCLATVRADDFTLGWYTIDGGGAMFSTGGNFELSGTIGQPDASTVAMAGGDISLTGGFWQGPVTTLCGDTNCDGVFDGADIDPFFLALAFPDQWPLFYSCDFIAANDANSDGAVDGADIDAFFEAITLGHCP